MKSINPHNLEVIAEFQEDSEQDVKEKLEKAQQAFEKHRWTSFEERASKMMKVAEDLKKNSRKYGEIMTREMGKPIKEAIAEAEKCAWVCEYYADNAEKFLSNEITETDADKSYVSYEPLGVILAVMPWNYPFWQVFRFAVPSIMAGNTGLLKHASNVQQCAEAMEKIFRDAGFEEGVFQNLAIKPSKVEEVLRNPILKAATVTGSEGAGAAVASVCGDEIKPTVLELGGSNSFIVLKDADLKKAAVLGVTARFMNAGQSCIASKRFILEESIADEFIELFVEELKTRKLGDPMKEDTQIGPVAREDLAKDLEDQLNRSVECGAELVCGGKREGAHFEPAVLKNVAPGCPAFDEEIFGPIAPMIIAKNEEEAIELSNNSPFGLGVSIITNDIEKAERLSRKIEDGAVFINELVKSDPRMPFGGTKKSGYGRELSSQGIREFVNVKAVHIKKEIKSN